MANRNFYRAGASRHRVDHRMRGSCLGAHALSQEYVSNAQAGWNAPGCDLNLESNHVGTEGNQLAACLVTLSAQRKEQELRLYQENKFRCC